MKFRLVAATLATFALAAGAGAASAAEIEVADRVANQLHALNSGVMLWDFDNSGNPNTDYSHAAHAAAGSGLGFNVPASGPNAGMPHIIDSAPPPFTGDPNVVGDDILVCCRSQDGQPYAADPTKYGSVQNEESGPGETFSALNGYYFTSFSFYMGSPDDYNRVIFNFVGGGAPQVLAGTAIWGGTPPGNGDRAAGYRVYYDFNGLKVSSITFKSLDNDAFEFDNFAGTLGVPEPATWAMMIMGFGAAGSMIRRRRAITA